MWTGLIGHSACLEHLPPRGHPESADRLRAVTAALDTEAFASLVRIEAPRADDAALLRAHARQHVDAVKTVFAAEASARGYCQLDPDTVMSAGSLEAALRASGAVIAAVDEIHAGRIRNAFCAVRPPGHHAERARAMGFCLFNNVAVGALHARAVHGYRRIAIVDFDVHHGNGTQDIFWSDTEAFYASSHQSPFYPGTGDSSECGLFGNVLNVPLHAGSGSRQFRAAYERQILPALQHFAPDFIFLSAGFDAHRDDPLAELDLVENDFSWVTHAVCEIARVCCGARVVSVLEGGYDLEALARSAAAHVRALMEA
ncbi:MAG TPA: histone deacetylase family protein [Rhizomicrobium sp.]|nr:histone deacetylase family protein [Rhizomicrobium sp.]